MIVYLKKKYTDRQKPEPNQALKYKQMPLYGRLLFYNTMKFNLLMLQNPAFLLMLVTTEPENKLFNGNHSELQTSKVFEN